MARSNDIVLQNVHDIVRSIWKFTEYNNVSRRYLNTTIFVQFHLSKFNCIFNLKKNRSCHRVYFIKQILYSTPFADIKTPATITS